MWLAFSPSNSGHGPLDLKFFELRAPVTPAFTTASTLLVLPLPQPLSNQSLAHSFKNKGGVYPSKAKLKRNSRRPDGDHRVAAPADTPISGARRVSTTLLSLGAGSTLTRSMKNV